MVGWIILGILILLILLIFFVPYGVDLLAKKELFRISIKAGPIHIRIYPVKPLTEKQKRKKEKKKAQKDAKRAKKAEKKAKSGEKTDNSIKVKKKKALDIEFLFALLKMAAHAIRRFFKSFTIDVFNLYFCAASRDPYDTSIEYGYACALAEALPELCGNVIHIKNRRVVIDADYTKDEPQAELHMALTLQLFKIIHVAIAFAAEFISWKIKHRKNDEDSTERIDNHGRKQDECTDE